MRAYSEDILNTNLLEEIAKPEEDRVLHVNSDDKDVESYIVRSIGKKKSAIEKNREKFNDYAQKAKLIESNLESPKNDIPEVEKEKIRKRLKEIGDSIIKVMENPPDFPVSDIADYARKNNKVAEITIEYKVNGKFILMPLADLL